MGKPPRSRSRLSSAAAASSGEMRKTRMKSPAASIADSRDCRASNMILYLLIGFGLAIFTIFVFRLRPGHPSLSKVSRKAILSTSGDDMDREIEGPKDRQLEPDDTVRVFGYEIIREFNHDPSAFTQGLAYGGNGTLYESTGLYGKSSVREVDLQTGEVRRNHQMNRKDFGEGLTIWKNRLLQVVWREKKVFIYNKATLLLQDAVSHPMQDGWGLTASNEHIIGSDGTSKLYFMDPDTFKEVRVVTVKDEDKEVGWLNELEFVNNEIWANIWQIENMVITPPPEKLEDTTLRPAHPSLTPIFKTEREKDCLITNFEQLMFMNFPGGCVARISPQDGKVTGWILLHGLRNELLSTGFQDIDVLNGIAWDSKEDKVFVTGKLWPKLYEIRLLDTTSRRNGSLQSVRKFCNIGSQGFQ